MKSIVIYPATCALCYRAFIRQRGFECNCGAVVCAKTDRPCHALHVAQQHIEEVV